MKLTRTRLPLTKLIGGAPLDLWHYELSSDSHGPSVYLQASVHGAEVQGNATLYELVKIIKENTLLGNVRFIPLANPVGSNQKRGTSTNGRYDPVTGNNWNRGYFNFNGVSDQAWKSIVELIRGELTSRFGVEAKVLFKKWMGEILSHEIEKVSGPYSLSYEKLMLYTLQREALAADMVIDLHTGPVACEYLYAPENCSQEARDLHASITLDIPLEFGGAMDEACFTPWHLLAQKLKSVDLPAPKPFEAYTMELGSEEYIDFEKARSQARRIAHFLYKRGVLAKDVLEISDKPRVSFQKPLSHFKTIFAPRAALYDFKARPGERVEAGTVLATGLELPFSGELESWQSAEFSVLAPKECAIINYCPTGIVSAGMELYQVLEL